MPLLRDNPLLFFLLWKVGKAFGDCVFSKPFGNSLQLNWQQRAPTGIPKKPPTQNSVAIFAAWWEKPMPLATWHGSPRWLGWSSFCSRGLDTQLIYTGVIHCYKKQLWYKALDPRWITPVGIGGKNTLVGASCDRKRGASFQRCAFPWELFCPNQLALFQGLCLSLPLLT